MRQQLELQRYNAWQLLKAYWHSPEFISAYALLGSVLIMSLMLVGMEVLFTTWYNYFYDALQDYDWRGTLDLLGIFIFLAGISIILSVYRYYLQNFLSLRWRRWLTEQFLNRWLTNRGYYYLEDFNGTTDNPDQRIQEDINNLVTLSMSLVIGILSAIVSIFAFIYILWKLSGVLHIPMGHYGVINIPGYLVWVALIYAVVGTALTFKIGRPLVGLNFEQQRREANFRFAAIDLRSNAEHIALYRGETQQKTLLQKIFHGVLENWYAIIVRQKLLLWFTAGYNQIAVILPLLAALPNYFNKVFKLGGLIQTLSAFGRIQEGLSFIVNSYTTLAEWQAVISRLLTFLNNLYEAEQKFANKHNFSYASSDENSIWVKHLTLRTPNNETLLADINQKFIHGKNYWLRGNSGIGKSTFVRAVAGIWPFGSGEIILPSKKNIMYIPQRSYMPISTLQEALLFPQAAATTSAAELIKLLQACSLPNLTRQLQHATRWSEHLSPGEMQRIAFVRILLQKPDWVFLDESTSALDLTQEQLLYELLKTELPHCSLISIGHRPSLAQYHEHEIDFSQYVVNR